MVLDKLLALSEPHLRNENIHVYLKCGGRGIRFNDVRHGHTAHVSINTSDLSSFDLPISPAGR